MKDKKIDEWIELKKRLEIYGYPSLLLPEKLEEFRGTSSIILPKKYLEFLRIFGQGRLGSAIRIHLPSIEWSNECIGCYEDALILCRELEWYSLEEVIPNLQRFKNAFAFGNTDRSELFLWDLRTYSSNDDSYDIYWIGIDSVESYWVGRDFFEFISEFCFGDQSFQVIPEDQQLHRNEISLVFTGECYKTKH